MYVNWLATLPRERWHQTRWSPSRVRKSGPRADRRPTQLIARS
jgi:hypothetical protein